MLLLQLFAFLSVSAQLIASCLFARSAMSPEQLATISSLHDEALRKASSRPTAKYLDGALTQIGTMSLTGDQRFLVLNGSTFFIYDGVAQTKMIGKVDLMKLEKLEIANKMVGTSLIIKEKERCSYTFYANDAAELTTWGVSIALNYIAYLPADCEAAEGVSEQLRAKAMVSTKQSEKQIDELMEQVYSIIGGTMAFNALEEDVLNVLKQLLSKLQGFDMNSGVQRNESPGIASQLVKYGLSKAKECFVLIIIALEPLVQPVLENWQLLKPRVLMGFLGWIMDFEELMSDFSIVIEEVSKFSRFEVLLRACVYLFSW
jgi:hypothetical protein